MRIRVFSPSYVVIISWLVYIVIGLCKKFRLARSISVIALKLATASKAGELERTEIKTRRLFNSTESEDGRRMLNDHDCVRLRKWAYFKYARKCRTVAATWFPCVRRFMKSLSDQKESS